MKSVDQINKKLNKIHSKKRWSGFVDNCNFDLNAKRFHYLLAHEVSGLCHGDERVFIHSLIYRALIQNNDAVYCVEHIWSINDFVFRIQYNATLIGLWVNICGARFFSSCFWVLFSIVDRSKFVCSSHNCLMKCFPCSPRFWFLLLLILLALFYTKSLLTDRILFFFTQKPHEIIMISKLLVIFVPSNPEKSIVFYSLNHLDDDFLTKSTMHLIGFSRAFECMCGYEFGRSIIKWPLANRNFLLFFDFYRSYFSFSSRRSCALVAGWTIMLKTVKNRGDERLLFFFFIEMNNFFFFSFCRFCRIHLNKI